jgi:hypothetical protein
MLIERRARSQLRLFAAIGRRIDGAVCAGALANAARSVHEDQLRAGQRQDARAAVEQLQLMVTSRPASA